MKKRFLCGLLSTAVIFSTCPAVFAADDMITLTESLDFRNATTDISGEGYSWDASSLTLTLENFRVVVPGGVLEEEAAIYLPDESTVEIKGRNNVIETRAYHCDAIHGEGEIWFEDKGALEIITESLSSSAIYAKKGPVIFDEKVEITVEPDGYIIRVDEAKGKNPIISFREDAMVRFPEKDARERNVLVTHKSSVKPTDNWLDYAEEVDEWDEDYIRLIAKDAVKPDKEEKPAVSEKEDTAPPVEEQPAEEPAKQSTYEITIGNAAIKKDGYVTYISDAKPFLKDGYTMLPLRALLMVTDPEMEVKWDAATKTVTAVVDGEKVEMPVDDRSNIFSKGEQEFKYNVFPVLKDGRVFISLRDWKDMMGIPDSQLSWDRKTKTVTFVH